MTRLLSLLSGGLLMCLASGQERPAVVPVSPFYAMDTALQRPGLTQAQQFDLVKELGYAGVAWHEQPPAEAQLVALELQKRGLKLFAIYCAAQVNAPDELTYSAELPALIQALSGQGTIIWLHIGGKGPPFESLASDSPLLKPLRTLADLAATNGLSVALYPHVGEWTARFGDAVRLANAVKHPHFGVTFNLCHSLAVGDEQRIPALLQDAGPLLKTVTLSGADSRVTGPNWGRLIQTLDKGSYDIAGLLKQLKQLGFRGPIGFQGYGINLDSRRILEPTMAKWRELNRR